MRHKWLLLVGAMAVMSAGTACGKGPDRAGSSRTSVPAGSSGPAVDQDAQAQGSTAGTTSGSPAGQSDGTPPTVEVDDSVGGGTSPTTARSTAEAPQVPVAPLTGLPTDDTLLAYRPAMVVKIDGHLRARPQWGIEVADIVIEEIVEGITRYMAIFHSAVPETVGPVRSARTQDLLIVPALNTPLFVWSGGNTKVTAAVRKAPLVNVSATNGWGLKGVWSRTKKRRAPHNLLAQGGAVLALAPEDAQAPQQLFSYLSVKGEPAGDLTTGAKIQMSGTRVQWLWNDTSRRWERTVDGKAHVAESGDRVTAANVVVLEVRYRSSAADPNSPEAQTTGSGTVLVLSAGRVQRGTWTRASTSERWTLRAEDGTEILLTPGQTWIELAKQGRTAIVDSGVDPQDVRWKAA